MYQKAPWSAPALSNQLFENLGQNYIMHVLSQEDFHQLKANMVRKFA
jgi:hypothetical protein